MYEEIFSFGKFANPQEEERREAERGEQRTAGASTLKSHSYLYTYQFRNQDVDFAISTACVAALRRGDQQRPFAAVEARTRCRADGAPADMTTFLRGGGAAAEVVFVMCQPG